MEVVNPFILKNKSRMIKYVDEIATVPNGYLDHSLAMEPDFVFKGHPDRELANILSICESHLHQIQAQTPNRVSLNLIFQYSLMLTLLLKPTLKKLFTVIEMLSAHKSKYLDLVP